MTTKPLHILIVEDSEEDTILLIRELQRGGLHPEHERVETAEAMRAALDRQSWDVIISDYALPKFNGTDALVIAREVDPDIPFICVSGTIGEEIAVEMMRSGAHDYVMKDKLARLAPAIERELREAVIRRERRQTERALKESESRFRRVVESNMEGIIFWDTSGNITEANDVFLQMTGYLRDDLAGGRLRWIDMTPPEYWRMEKAALDELEQKGTCAPFEKEFIRKDGVRVPVLIGGAFLEGRNDKGVSFVLDITEQKHARAALSHMASIVESSDDAIIGKTLDGIVLSWNKGAERMHGYTAEEIVGKSISIVFPPDLIEEMSAIFDRLRQGERLARYETIRLRKDGQLIHVSLTISPIKDSQGRIIAVSTIARDITERKQEENERLRLISELSEALAKVKTLRGLLPICASCKKIRDDRGYWQQLEVFVKNHSEADFSHAICPDCMTKLYPEFTART